MKILSACDGDLDVRIFIDDPRCLGTPTPLIRTV